MDSDVKNSVLEIAPLKFDRLPHGRFAFLVLLLQLGYTLARAQAPPVITTQPADQSALIGGTVILQVTATGSGLLTYQWQFNGTNLPRSIITTVAGNGIQGFSGDGAAAVDASLANPSALALDAAGNLFIADTWNNCIRKLATNGIISTAAGNATQGYSGDGGAATNASLTGPSGVALDAAGNLFIADSWNRCIRRVTMNGIISTIAGNGTQGYAGDGGAATNASLFFPAGIAVDATGNLFIADTLTNVIRKVTTNGFITTVAGTGAQGYAGDGAVANRATLSGPSGVAVDALGNLFIVDTGNNVIRRVDTNGVISTVAGNGFYSAAGDGGAATNASLARPAGVFVDTTGNLFIADRYNHRIREVTTDGMITTVAGNGVESFSGDGGAATEASLDQPFSAVVDSAGNLFVADNGNSRIREVTTTAFATLTLGDIAPADAGDYQLIVANSFGAATSRVARITVILSPSITVPPANQTALLGDTVTLQVTAVGAGPMAYQWQLNGTNLSNIIITTVAGGGTNYPADGSAATGARLAFPNGVAVDGAGNLFVADSGHLRVWRVGRDGLLTTAAGGGTSYPGDGGAATDARLAFPNGVAVDAIGNLFITDSSNNRIRRVDTNGVITTVAGNGRPGFSGDTGPATNASLLFPGGVAVDNAGNLFIADRGNNRIRKVDPDGFITTVAGGRNPGFSGDGHAATNASLNFPSGVAVDTNGNLFIADYSNQRIRQVNTNGLISTVVGNGLAGYSGDGGAATNASLRYPDAVAVDTANNLFITDSGNNRIRRVDTNGVVTTIAGSGRFGYSGDGGAPTEASLASPSGVAVDALGNVYLADPSNSRIREISSIGSPTYTLLSVSTASAGDYRVIVTNSYGVATSQVATITVALPPLGVGLETGPAVFLQGAGVPGDAYRLEVAAALSPPVLWRPVVTNAVDASGYWSFLDTNTAAPPMRFYRLRKVP